MLRDAEVESGSVEMESLTLDSGFDTGTNINSPRTDRRMFTFSCNLVEFANADLAVCEDPICVVTRLDVEMS